VIIFTESTSWDERMQAMRLGATDYWLKPTSFERSIDMMRRLRRYLHPLDSRPQGQLRLAADSSLLTAAAR
jgi:DNA-binding NtrC family response regulator